MLFDKVSVPRKNAISATSTTTTTTNTTTTTTTAAAAATTTATTTATATTTTTTSTTTSTTTISSSSSYVTLQPYESLRLLNGPLTGISVLRILILTRYFTFLQISLHAVPLTIPGFTSLWFIIEDSSWNSVCIHSFLMANPFQSIYFNKRDQVLSSKHVL